MSLGRWVLLLWSIFEATVQAPRTGMWSGCLWLRTVGCDGVALLPNKIKLWDGFHGCLDSLVSLTQWLRLGTIFSIRWG